MQRYHCLPELLRLPLLLVILFLQLHPVYQEKKIKHSSLLIVIRPILRKH